LIAFLSAALLATSAYSQSDANCVVDLRGNQVCGSRPGQCTLDRYRNAWCAPANGTVAKDRYDEVLCGAGACATDRTGNVRCAATPGGSVSTAPTGELVCEGGCVAASKALCRQGP
jgi:hypothetical protein